MNLARLTKQLKRDLKASPAKAGALGVLTIVAAVFWGPLLFKSEEKPKQSGGMAVAAPGGAAPPAGHAAPSSKAPVVDWRVLARGLAADPRMQSHAAVADGPFRAKTPEEEDAEWFALLDELAGAENRGETPPLAAPTAPPKFDDYPLRLSSTIVGTRFRKAVINGKAHGVGSEIDMWNGSAITLAEIEPRYAVVEWNGKRREVAIPKPGETPKPVPAAAPESSPAGVGTDSSEKSSEAVDR
jgi:hypothetical protein